MPLCLFPFCPRRKDQTQATCAPVLIPSHTLRNFHHSSYLLFIPHLQGDLSTGSSQFALQQVQISPIQNQEPKQKPSSALWHPSPMPSIRLSQSSPPYLASWEEGFTWCLPCVLPRGFCPSAPVTLVLLYPVNALYLMALISYDFSADFLPWQSLPVPETLSFLVFYTRHHSDALWPIFLCFPCRLFYLALID